MVKAKLLTTLRIANIGIGHLTGTPARETGLLSWLEKADKAEQLQTLNLVMHDDRGYRLRASRRGDGGPNALSSALPSTTVT
jgi:hypothetical protein